MHIVLVNPLIPQNTGTIARSCAGTDTELILCGRLGFSLEDKYMKRAGLDYWEHVNLRLVDDFSEVERLFPEERMFLFSKYGVRSYTDVIYPEDAVLIFGSEDLGLPMEIMQRHRERTCRIIHNNKIRCLNLSSSVNIVLFEALRQIGAA